MELKKYYEATVLYDKKEDVKMVDDQTVNAVALDDTQATSYQMTDTAAQDDIEATETQMASALDGDEEAPITEDWELSARVKSIPLTSWGPVGKMVFMRKKLRKLLSKEAEGEYAVLVPGGLLAEVHQQYRVLKRKLTKREETVKRQNLKLEQQENIIRKLQDELVALRIEKQSIELELENMRSKLAFEKRFRASQKN